MTVNANSGNLVGQRRWLSVPGSRSEGLPLSGSGSFGGGLSRLLVAAFVLVLTAAAFAQARPYTLQWDPNFDSVTTGYQVSYGTAPGVYGSTGGIDAGNVTSFQVDLLPGTTYYFSVRAYAAGNVLGPASTEFSFFVPLDATLNVSSTNVGGGASVTATVLSGPGNRLDRIALYPVGSSTQLDWKYLNGSQTAPATGVTTATVPFTMPVAVGQYNFRFIPNGATNPLATSATVTVMASSITPSVTTVAAGATLTATVANGPGNRLDWVAVCPPSATSGCTDWKYLNGTRAAPASGLTGATLTFAVPTTAGQYMLKFFVNDTQTVLATSVAVTVTGGDGGGGGGSATPSVTPSVTTVAAGATLTASVANGPGNRLDWVALCPPSATSGCTDWKYLNGTRAAPASGLTGATLTFAVPTTAGQYMLKFFVNDTQTVLATSVAVTVTGGDGGGGGGSATPSVTPSVTTVAAGATLTASVANGPGNRLDWVALCPPSATSGCTDWKYLNGTRAAPASGLTGATLTFAVPTTAGQYTLKFFLNDTQTLLATSVTVTVTGGGGGGSVTPSVTPSVTTVAAGANLTATVANGPGNLYDWVGLYASGSTTLLDWKYLSGTRVAPATGLTGAAVTFTAPTTPGSYDLRFFPNNSFTLLATSVPVTVTGGGSVTPSITPSATTVAAGANLTATVANGPGNRLDWVGLYASGSTTLLDWKYLNGTRVAPTTGVTGAALTFTMPTKPGLYTLGFFQNDTFVALGWSPRVTVQ